MLKTFLKTRTPLLFAILRRVYRLCRRIFSPLMRAAGSITKYFEKDPCVIIWIDGGICSQIFRYLKGRWYAKRGFNVKYDITWYDDNPKDILGIEDRNFLLLKCFPDIDFEAASSWELKKYRLLYSKSKRAAMRYREDRYRLKAPLYDFLYALDWIISSEQELEGLAKCLKWESLHNILGSEAKKIEASIVQNRNNGLKTIGLHVRRGDMAAKQFGFRVLNSRYYEHVLSLAADENSVVYVFSNGFDFVAESVVPHIKCRYVLADKTEGVHEDIFLCSLCDMQISSQGSLGKYAYLFNTNKDRKLIRPFFREQDKENLLKYYAGSYGTVEFAALTEDMYEH